MSKLYKLVTPPKHPPNESIITRLRECLRDAKLGRIQAIMIAMAIVDDDVENQQATENVITIPDDWHQAAASAFVGLCARMYSIRQEQSASVDKPIITDEDE